MAGLEQISARGPLIPACLFLIGAWPAMADGPQARGAELRQVAYLYGVVEYCSLDSFEVHDGYEREMSAIIARERLSDTEAREQRLHGLVDADLEYGDRGLGGFRKWCRTEGMDAARRFVDFRDAQLAVDPRAGGDLQSP
jgi:hypothetical protein